MNNHSSQTNFPEEILKIETEKQEERIKKTEERIKKLETKSIQTLNLYFIFQAIILTSTTTKSPALNCNKWWVPFSLSLLASVLNLFALLGILSNTWRAREKLDQHRADLELMKLYRFTRAQVSQVLPGNPLNQEISRPKPDSIARWKRHLMGFLCVGLFVGFSGVVMYGCYSIMCHSSGGNCVKVC